MTYERGTPEGDAYHQGYAEGREKAFFEVRSRLTEEKHKEDCGHEECKLILEVLDLGKKTPYRTWSVVIED